MVTADGGVPLNDFVVSLARSHRQSAPGRCPGSFGRRERQYLDGRFDAIQARIAGLSAVHSAKLIGLDWLHDNQHVIREAIAQVAGNLSRGFVRSLPAVEAVAGSRKLRIKAVAESIVERAALPLDIEWIEHFVTRYQRELPLTLGELWALPSLLRTEVVRCLLNAADEVLDQVDSGVSEPDDAPVSSTLAGCVISLRTLATSDWQRFVERLSVVERLLREDPSGSYSRMTAESRNRYRERVETLARRLDQPESRVAGAAVDLARAASRQAHPRERHAGYYLIDSGVDRLVANLLGRPPLGRRFFRRMESWKPWVYVATIVLPTAATLGFLWGLLKSTDLWLVGHWLFAVLAAVPALTIWTEIVNWLVTQVRPPRVLPKLDFSRGIPRGDAAGVAVPCMLSSTAEIDRLLTNLETNYLGNDDPCLVFVLLSDYTDADEAELEEDRDLLHRALGGIDALNTRYGDPSRQPFALLHRRRLWNASAGIWMGWERKRGKIGEFNRWLLGAEDTSFERTHGGIEALRKAKYVITLDADNQLLPGAAAELVGALAHPLNRPQIDSASGRVIAGYSIVQPRVELQPASANRTLFSRLVSGDVGIDLYHTAVSETYHDFFGQGIYAGKGIYELRAFSRSVSGLIPPNAVLSHDLLEGILGRTGLASDIVVLENACPSLTADLKRQHRWIRGDWQLLPWLFGIRRVSLLGRWMLFDNLRRSLLPLSLLGLLFFGWLFVPEHAAVWTLAVAAVPGVSILFSLAGDVRHSTFRWGTLRSTLIRLSSRCGQQVGQWLHNLVVLPIVAYTILDAIVRTLMRLLISRRRLLEWTPAAQTDSDSMGTTLAGSYRQMIAAPLAGLCAGVVAVFASPTSLLSALVIGAGWLAAPALAWFLAQEHEKQIAVSAGDRAALRMLARRTWQFYERFVGPETHWLPPDNLQEAPKFVLAERTSPTNIGLFLISAVAAYDLKYLGAIGLLTRIEGTTDTISRMAQFRGHLFNWYSTRDLSVLEPAYVSTVDSGNLLAALLTCRSAILEIEHTALPHVRAPAALGDIVAQIEDVLADNHDGAERGSKTMVSEVLAQVRRSIEATPRDVTAWEATLSTLVESLCLELDDAVLQLAEAADSGWSVEKIDLVRTWIIQLRHEASTLHTEATEMARCLQMSGGDTEKSSSAHLRTLGDYLAVIEAATAPHPDDPAGPVFGSGADDDVLLRSARQLDDLLGLRDRLIARIDRVIAATDFGFLLDADRQLFHIGYNNTTGELDPSYYDLLASEARTASLIAIAKGDVPISHWVHLGRPLRRLRGMRVLLSWSATAFEYLMPRLFMETPAHGLLEASCRAVVREQRKLARRGRIPWGLSESAYYDLDNAGHYKYYAFGVDALALRRPARRRYVVSPYASLLALPFDPYRVLENLEVLRDHGCWGRYGLYEALDFGERPGTAARPRLVRSFMAHHQAMSIAALANFLCDDSLLRRFHANAEIAAVEHLLYEALPRRAEDRVIRYTAPPPRGRDVPLMTSDHVKIAPDRLQHFVNLLGNGHLTVRTTALGSGDTLWNDYSITRWQPRTSGPMGGERIYLSDLDGGDLHVLGATGEKPGSAPDCWCAPHETELHQRIGAILARLSICVVAESDVALKRITLTNDSRSPRRVCLTHYAEMVLAPAAADRRHPAFNKLFVESEFIAGESTLVFSRRRRSAVEPGICAAVSVSVPDEFEPTLYYTCDRRSFLGRNGNNRAPAALSGDDPAFDGKTGSGLDPVAAIAVTLAIPPGETAQVVFISSAAPDRHHALDMIRHCRSPERVQFGFDQARQYAAAVLTDLSMDSNLLMRLLTIYADMLWPQPLSDRARTRVRNAGSILSALWSRGISGDYPIGMIRVGRQSETTRVEEALALQNFLARRMTPVDLILIDDSPASYAETVRNRLDELIERYRRPGQRGNAFVLTRHSLSPQERAALDAAALVHIDAGGGTDFTLRERYRVTHQDLPGFVPVRAPRAAGRGTADAIKPPDLDFDNGYGGLDPASGDYVIRADTRTPTPAPWINVLANPGFGCIISESGSSSTWYRNSSEHRLTSWYNDPVTDRSGEALYIRDEETGEFWSPMPAPVPGGERYLVRHGAGYSGFEHLSHDVRQRVICFVDAERPAKVYKLRLRNTADRPRRFTVTYFAECVFGNHYEDMSPYVVPEMDELRRTVLMRNLHPRFLNERVAFVTSTAPLHGFTTDRREFLGVERDLGRPAALRRIGFSGDIVAGAEPCCAYQIHLDLAEGGVSDVSFVFGAADDRREALSLADPFQSQDFIEARLEATKHFWQDLLSGCQVRTPNKALDYLFNRWLPYQNLAARLWARTGLYQSAGGFGFRDQLQDSLALVHTQADMTRAQIIRACGAQFVEGDVLHWWHEDPLRGVRTRCSDDLLWLPYAVSEYLKFTGDSALLDETVPYLDGESLQSDEHERYAEFSPGDRLASVYTHCCAAIDARAAVGSHGLPFIGSGDWNDGLNRVGIDGRGESVWLGWFLADIYARFGGISAARGDDMRAGQFAERRKSLLEALESNAWDGDWYLRAFYDDGSSLGAAANNECKIDLNAQTWPAITGLAAPDRAKQAVDSARQWLVDEQARLIKLLAPPFDRTLKDPGYIKGYPPGVRENGGQYTHAATWAVWAAVRLNRPELAMAWSDLLNPLLRVTDRHAADRYLGEPYVLAGDVCGTGPSTGQSGWTWYTGSAGWFYRIILEQMLGFRPVRGKLGLRPCVPADWSEFEVDYRVGDTCYSVSVREPARIAETGVAFELDGNPVAVLEFVDDGSDHRVLATPAAAGH